VVEKDGEKGRLVADICEAAGVEEVETGDERLWATQESD
jgi:hypothetical protein